MADKDKTERIQTDDSVDHGTQPEPRPEGEETHEFSRSDKGDVADSGSPVSDVQLADETIQAPSFRAPAERKESPPGPREFHLQPGDEIGDFEVVEVLGRGAFGVVYLARQKSLDRRVALKITANRGSEGRTMARLEHDHIVQVFSESIDETAQFRLLCMQLVPGASLEAVIRDLRQVTHERGSWNGADYLAAIDKRTKVSDTFDPSALRDRELLSEANDVETAAWVGARLAEAMNFAHVNGVMHRDIKPANVLINQYWSADVGRLQHLVPVGRSGGRT